MGDDFAMGYAMGQDNNNNCNGGDWFGGGGIWGLLILALLFGWGSAGFGGGGLFGGIGGGGGNGALTRAAVAEGFQVNGIDNGIRSIQNGIADSTYALNNSIMSGFHGVDNAICNLGYQTQANFANLAAQNASCCCETQRLIERGFCDVGYAMATNTSNIIQNSHSDTDRVIAKLDAMENARMAEKLDALRNENLALKFQASQASQNAFITANQEAQTATLLRRLGAECPAPAYLVNAPTPVTFPVNSCGQVQFGGGCGCGTYTT